MGSYTTNLKLYKPDGSEFVDPEVQLNRNWDICDAAVRRLLEYEYSPLQTPDVVGSVDRARFYQPYSNKFSAYFKTGNFFYQDPNAFVSSWVSAKNLLNPETVEHPDFPLAYRIVKRTGGSITEIEWTGAVWANGNELAHDVSTTIVETGIVPVGVRPTVSKYSMQWAGNTTTDYSIARILFGSGGNIQYMRYGTEPPFGDERRLEFTGIKYSLEVTGS